MSEQNPPNSEVLMQRIMALEQRLNEQASLEAVQKQDRGVLSKERQIENIFRGTGPKVNVPDRGLKYPKYIGHPTRTKDGAPVYRIAKDEYDEVLILEQFTAEAAEDRAASSDHADEQVVEVVPKKRGRKPKGDPAEGVV